MPPLDNPRWERFAQQLVKGKSQTEAYRNAGYRAKAATVNASQLLTKPKVAERLRELQEGAAARAEVTVASILNELEDARKLAAEINQPSAAVAATLGKAKVAGLIVERKEVGKPGDFEGMNVDELRDYITREAARLGIGVQDAGEEGEGGAVGGQLN
jgi:phage terminase small subunit